MAQSLDKFIKEMKIDIDNFEKEYRKMAETDKNYPLKMEDGNEGLWLEFFIEYVTNEII